jgi:hypothetical protein
MVDATMSVLEGDITPPDHVKLREGDQPFWLDIVRARARKEWRGPELQVAANLARCQADIERIALEIDVEGDTIENAKGTEVVNPKHALLEVLSRKSLALMRILQIQPAATGKAEDKVGQREAERKAREVNDSLKSREDEDASLLA